MAFFYNPKGVPLPHPERHDLPAGTQLVFGTAKDDTFVFDKGHARVVIGLGGDNVYNAAASPLEYAKGDFSHVRYYDYLREKEWVDDGLGQGRPWEPWKSGNSIAHVGGGMDVKLGIGADKIVAHGGHYKHPLKVWVQPDDRVYMAGNDEDVIRFDIGRIKPDSDGKGYTAPVGSVTVRGHVDDNPITDGQLVKLVFTDQGTYYDRPGHNIFEQAYVDFKYADGPNIYEVQNFIDGKGIGDANWDVLV